MSITAVLDLPSNLNMLLNNLPFGKKLNKEKLVNEHTLFPFYRPFLSEQQAEQVLLSMLEEDGRSVQTRSGIMAGSILHNDFLRYCPKCHLEDYEKYGEMYWHRLHQVPGAFICPIHKVLLQDSVISICNRNKHQFIAANFESCPYVDENINNEMIEDLLAISLEIDWLLRNNLYPQRDNWFREKYRTLLGEKGLLSKKGFVNQVELEEQFKNFYNEKILNLLRSNPDSNFENNWLRSIVRKHRKTFHPIRHILFIRFLGLSLNDFFKSIAILNEKPFGNGPWPCMNKVADHYLQPIIEKVQIDNGKKHIGTFSCSCGFVYSRGIDFRLEDRSSFKVKKIGYVWESNLKIFVNQGLSLRETARRLAADPKTIKKYVAKLGLAPTWNLNAENKEMIIVHEESETIRDRLKQFNRSIWKHTCELHPLLNRTGIRKVVPEIFTWLYRNDRSWLDDNSPKTDRSNPVNKRVDWGKRDEQILEAVKKAISSIMDSEENPLRISVSRVGKEINQLAILEKHLDKLPLTRRYLRNFIEDTESFQIRRIRWIIRNLEQHTEEIKPWLVMRKAGIKPNVSDIVKAEINKYCN